MSDIKEWKDMKRGGLQSLEDDDDADEGETTFWNNLKMLEKQR